MRKVHEKHLLVILLVIILTAILTHKWSNPSDKTLFNSMEEKMKIESIAFKENENIPREYTCQGDNVNPPLNFSDIPKGTKSIALIVDDPDAPSGVWAHWLVWNMNPTSDGVGENSVPKGGIQGPNGRGANKYQGPCPPSGVHRYYFKLFALNKELNISTTTDKTGLENAMDGAIIEQSLFIGLYERK